MGAWGYDLFENDSDLDLLDGSTKTPGLERRRTRRRRRPSRRDPMFVLQADTMTTSLISPCGPTLAVILHSSSSVWSLASYAASSTRRANLSDTCCTNAMADHAGDERLNEFVILDACAISHGCKLPDDFKELLIKTYRFTRLFRMGRCSMQVALGDGPERYR
jgi:hypothetical protein